MPTPAIPAIVLLSGGLDSATVLALMRRDGFAVHAISFDYGQRHKEELHYAGLLAQTMGHRRTQLPLGVAQGLAQARIASAERSSRFRSKHQCICGKKS